MSQDPRLILNNQNYVADHESRQAKKSELSSRVEEFAAPFQETDHPRNGGRFTKKNGPAKKAAPAKAAAPQTQGIPKGTNTDNTAGKNVPVGLTTAGNLNLHERPVVLNPDGTVSTVRTISIGTDQGEVLLPTVIGNKVVSNQEAIDHYKKTGEHLGVFDTPDHADAYSQVLHKAQEKEYAAASKDAIKQAQFKLIKGGARIKADGIWGPKTTAAAKRFGKALVSIHGPNKKVLN